MSDLISQGAAWLAGVRKASLSRPITYSRQVGLTTKTASLVAAVGETVFTIADANGITNNIESRDYIVLADDLIFAGDSVGFQPVGGDKIREILRGVTHEYEVLPPSSGTASEDSDRDKNSIRIHTKFVGTT